MLARQGPLAHLWHSYRVVEAMLEQKLESVLPEPDPCDLPASLSEPARQLTAHLQEREREVEIAQRLRRAAKRTISIDVDRAPTDFLVLSFEMAWAAAARIGELDVSMLGEGIAPDQIELRRVSPADYQ